MAKHDEAQNQPQVAPVPDPEVQAVPAAPEVEYSGPAPVGDYPERPYDEAKMTPEQIKAAERR